MSRILIVGNGPAAHRLVERLRHYGHTGAITVIGAEARPAYNRVLLTSVLEGALDAAAVQLPCLDADVRLGVTATAVDRTRRLVHLDTGETFGYDELVLATGARPRLPELSGLRTVDGTLADGVTALRTIADCAQITGDCVTVLGGGILGVETAHALSRHGRGVTVVHPWPCLMERQLDATAADLLAESMRDNGISLRLARKALEYRPGWLTLDDGNEVRSDNLVLCTGIAPETGLAGNAGLETMQGIVVNDQLRTADERIHAIGDCTEHRGRTPGLVTNAWEQAESLARQLTGDQAHHVPSKSIFRLKVRDLDLVSAGSESEPDGETVRLSDAARGRYAALTVRNQRITGAIVVGFAQAIASSSQLHDRDGPVPADRLGLLLGAAATSPAKAREMPEDAIVCRCNNVTRKALTRSWHDGARDVAQLAKATRATTGCGSCAEEVSRLCTSLAGSSTETEKENAA